MSSVASLNFNLRTIDWQAISSIVSLAALCLNAILIYSLAISLKAVRESRSTKESSILIWALEKVDNVRPTMNAIKSNSKDIKWMSANKSEILDLVGVLQMISYFALEDLIPRDRIADVWGKSFVEQWIYLEGFVREFRAEIGEAVETDHGAYYARSFEAFASYAKSHLDRHYATRWPATDRRWPTTSS